MNNAIKCSKFNKMKRFFMKGLTYKEFGTLQPRITRILNKKYKHLNTQEKVFMCIVFEQLKSIIYDENMKFNYEYEFLSKKRNNTKKYKNGYFRRKKGKMLCGKEGASWVD